MRRLSSRRFGLAARFLVASVAGAALLGLQPASQARPTQVDARPAAAPSWLSRLNTWRQLSAVSHLTENTTYSQGDYNHALYMVKNNLVTHYETPGTPYYTVAGDTAAQHSNIYVSSSTATTDDQAIDWWMQAPFHELGLMDPRLATTGFGSYREAKPGWDMGAAVDVLSGNSFTGGQYPVYFPGNGSSEPLTTYGGYESPDPLQACPGYAAPTGLPISIQVGGNVATAVGAHSFTSNGLSLAHCVIDSTNATLGSSLRSRGAVILIPQQPLITGTTYTVSLTVNGNAYSWWFKVGPPAINLCASGALTPAAVMQHLGTTVNLTASSTGCSNPRYEFWVQYPNGNWYLAQGWGGASFSWDTTGLNPGVYTVHAWVNTVGTSWDTYGTAMVTLTGCSTAALTPATASQPAGSLVSLTASSSGCGAPLYEFWVKYPNGSWYLKQGWGSSAVFNWDTTGSAPGNYVVHAWVGRQATTWDAIGESIVTLTGCTSASVSPATASQSVGTTVNMTVSSGGCPSPVYEFWIQYPNGSWNLRRGWSTTASFGWDTSGLRPGMYLVHAWANQQGAAPTLEVYGTATITLAGCTASSVVPASGSVAVGASVTFTAGATGCPAPIYEFWLQDPNGVWHLMQSFGTSSTWTWATSGWAKGVYTLHVWTDNQGSDTTWYQTIGSATYSLT